jgi:hypothetical protein
LSKETVWPERPLSPVSCVRSAFRSLNTVPVTVLGAYSPIGDAVTALPEVVVTVVVPTVEKVSPASFVTDTV